MRIILHEENSIAVGKVKEENPIWTMKDLEIYLSKIEVNESKDKSSISIKVSVDTTEIDEALKKAKELAEVLERISKLSENIEGLIKLTNTMSKMSCEGKQCWLEDLRTIASVSQPN